MAKLGQKYICDICGNEVVVTNAGTRTLFLLWKADD